jgi:DNA-directed RNA polymerase specialized sigma24 family protein
MPLERSSDGSVTRWIRQLKAGDHAAVQPLWERYFDRLVRVAREKLRGVPRRAEDEEDAALKAFDSLCRGAEHGQFPQLHDRDDLWRLLLVLVARKAWNQARSERQQKRGQGKVHEASAFRPSSEAMDEERILDQVIGPEPSPEFALLVADEWQTLFDRLGDATLRSVAQAKLEGQSNMEIAARMDCGLRTVERKLRLIRQIWEKEIER